MIKPASRKTTSKYVTVTLDGKYNAPCIQNLRQEGKAGSFNVTQVSRIATRDQNCNLEGR